MTEPTCRMCKFFTVMGEQEGVIVGTCRRFPPLWTNDTAGWQFPGMKEIGWCGEHTPKVTIQ